MPPERMVDCENLRDVRRDGRLPRTDRVSPADFRRTQKKNATTPTVSKITTMTTMTTMITVLDDELLSLGLLELELMFEFNALGVDEDANTEPEDEDVGISK